MEVTGFDSIGSKLLISGDDASVCRPLGMRESKVGVGG